MTHPIYDAMLRPFEAMIARKEVGDWLVLPSKAIGTDCPLAGLQPNPQTRECMQSINTQNLTTGITMQSRPPWHSTWCKVVR